MQFDGRQIFFDCCTSACLGRCSLTSLHWWHGPSTSLSCTAEAPLPLIRHDMVVGRLQWPAIDTLQAALQQRPQGSVPAAASGWMYFDGDGDSVEVRCVVGPGAWSTCSHQRHGPPCPSNSQLQPAGRMRCTRPQQRAARCKAQVSDAEGNFLSFSAMAEPASAADGVARGAVTAHFGRPSRAGGLLTEADCGRVVWPHLQAVRILGMHQQVCQMLYVQLTSTGTNADRLFGDHELGQHITLVLAIMCAGRSSIRHAGCCTTQ